MSAMDALLECPALGDLERMLDEVDAPESLDDARLESLPRLWSEASLQLTTRLSDTELAGLERELLEKRARDILARIAPAMRTLRAYKARVSDQMGQENRRFQAMTGYGIQRDHATCVSHKV
ncbi:hypothetical protein [Magnetofaba australis]|uniref:Uncharacterized protein n=1 Tax=Magnetofaba australis IT-1 TaxID=1434232 RepID=A0A1Y2K9I3_9PROT|nr:hypothetical protein [Magnetofaba australis]OSM06110.1 hypothetical protein MAIT1_01065 [Magnetofaba australis IT-1]